MKDVGELMISFILIPAKTYNKIIIGKKHNKTMLSIFKINNKFSLLALCPPYMSMTKQSKFKHIAIILIVSIIVPFLYEYQADKNCSFLVFGTKNLLVLMYLMVSWFNHYF
ncbi:MAG: hypothetical protein K6F29_05790 [Bacteroidales bacterium]|nr:hypothetical protein [Bacteroidales bacterium]